MEGALEVSRVFLEAQRSRFNTFAAAYEPWLVALAAVVLYVVVKLVWDTLFQEQPLFERIKLGTFRQARRIPWVRRYIENEVEQSRKGIESDLMKHAPKRKYPELPMDGMPNDQLIKLLQDEYQGCGDPMTRLKQGKVSGTIYVGGEGFEQYTDMLTKVYGMFAWTNPLHPGVFPGVRQMEAEVVAFTTRLFGGDDEACGSMTSGGTESILMAIKAYRDWARDVKGITNPNLVTPRTAHPAFDKACQYFCINIRKVPEDPITLKADVRAMRKAIDSNTIAIVGSCPQYPHGVVDPIEELAALAKSRGIGMHVDCCLGSFLVCFMRKAGYKDFPAFDLSVPGVTSISADTHKFGYAPKGSSVVLFSNRNLRRYQYSVFPNWPGGIYGTPNVAGSRPGALIAATWAAMMSHGERGYIAKTKAIVEIARRVEEAIKTIPGLKLMARADVSVVSWGSDHFDINRMVEPFAHEKGWDINVLQFPAAVHVCFTMAHTAPGVVDRFLADLSEVTAALMKAPKEKVSGAGALYGTSQKVPDRSVIVDVVHSFLDVTLQVEKKRTGDSKKKD